MSFAQDDSPTLMGVAKRSYFVLPREFVSRNLLLGPAAERLAESSLAPVSSNLRAVSCLYRVGK